MNGSSFKGTVCSVPFRGTPIALQLREKGKFWGREKEYTLVVPLGKGSKRPEMD